MPKLVDYDLISRKEALDAMYFERGLSLAGAVFVSLDEVLGKLRGLPSTTLESSWTPILDGDGQMPPIIEGDRSEPILISCSNLATPVFGFYKVDEEGGAFYGLGDMEPLITFDAFPNAWMPLPKPYGGDN